VVLSYLWSKCHFKSIVLDFLLYTDGIYPYCNPIVIIMVSDSFVVWFQVPWSPANCLMAPPKIRAVMSAPWRWCTPYKIFFIDTLSLISFIRRSLETTTQRAMPVVKSVLLTSSERCFGCLVFFSGAPLEWWVGAFLQRHLWMVDAVMRRANSRRKMAGRARRCMELG
jgi:hypothetical protein